MVGGEVEPGEAQAELADHGMVEVLDADVVEAHVVGGPAGAERLAVLRLALEELYAFYGQNRADARQRVSRREYDAGRPRALRLLPRLPRRVARDAHRRRHLRGAARRRTRAALGHAVAFSTWKSLVREHGLDHTDAAALVRALVSAAS